MFRVTQWLAAESRGKFYSVWVFSALRTGLPRGGVLAAKSRNAIGGKRTLV